MPNSPRPADSVPGLPLWSWEALTALAQSLATDLRMKVAAAHLIDAARTGASTMGEAQVRREIALTFAMAIDPSFGALAQESIMT